MLSQSCIKPCFVCPSEPQPCPGWSFVLMAPRNAPGPSAPPYPTPPPGVMEYLAMLAQNGQLPLSANQTLAPPAPPTSTPDVPPPSEIRSFNRVGRGQGGALMDKQKASKEVMASNRKRKSLVELDVEVYPPSTPSPVVKNAGKQSTVKRLKTTKTKLPVSKSSQSSNQIVPTLDPPHPEESLSPVRPGHTVFGTSPHTDIACRFPCRLLRALYPPYRVWQSHAIPSHHLTPLSTVISNCTTLSCPHFTVSPDHAPHYSGLTFKAPHDIDNSNERVTESQDDEVEGGSDHPESESEIPVQPSQSRNLVPTSPWNLVCVRCLRSLCLLILLPISSTDYRPTLSTPSRHKWGIMLIPL